MTGARTKRAVTTKFLLAVDKGDKTVNSVSVAGTFTSWIAIPLYFENGYWEARLGVNPGWHQYKFIVDGVWIHDDAKHNVANDQGTRNNTLVIFRGANVAEVSSSCLKHIKSGKVFRDSQKREILKAVSRLSERDPVIDEAAARAKKEAQELEATRIEAERTRDQEAIARDIKEGLLKNAVKREIVTPLKAQVEPPVYDILDDAVFNPNVELKQIEDFVPKHLQTKHQFVNWGAEKLNQIREENEMESTMESTNEDTIKWKVGEMESTSEETIKWKVGDECVAKWRGRYWYNGQILEIIHDQVLVKYLDCADEDYASLEELKPAGSLTEVGTLREVVTDSSAGATVKLAGSSRSTEGKPTLAGSSRSTEGKPTLAGSSRSTEGKPTLAGSSRSTEGKPTLGPGRCAE